MRPKATLGEVMGKTGGEKGENLTLDDLSSILGERLPKLEFTPVGRMRLTAALRVRFGDSYKNLPGIQNILKEFNTEAQHNVKMQEMKMIRAAAKGKG